MASNQPAEIVVALVLVGLASNSELSSRFLVLYLTALRRELAIVCVLAMDRHFAVFSELFEIESVSLND